MAKISPGLFVIFFNQDGILIINSAKAAHQINSYKNGENILKNDLKVYMSIPLIFNQGASFSNIIDRDVDYTIWVRGCIDAYVNLNKLNIKPHLK